MNNIKMEEVVFMQNTQNISKNEAKNYNSLVFAFVGDSVFSLYVRTFFATKTTAKAGVLHSKTSSVVRAKTQAMILDDMQEILLEEEKLILNNARNLHTKNIAKNSNIEEYKKSTSFEAVLGYLFLTNQKERLNEILKFCEKYFS